MTAVLCAPPSFSVSSSCVSALTTPGLKHRRAQRRSGGLTRSESISRSTSERTNQQTTSTAPTSLHPITPGSTKDSTKTKDPLNNTEQGAQGWLALRFVLPLQANGLTTATLKPPPPLGPRRATSSAGTSQEATTQYDPCQQRFDLYALPFSWQRCSATPICDGDNACDEHPGDSGRHSVAPVSSAWVSVLVRGITEVMAGQRTPQQLMHMITLPVHDYLRSGSFSYIRAHHTSTRQPFGPATHPPSIHCATTSTGGSTVRGRAVVHSIHITQPSASATEVCATVSTGQRYCALALRLEIINRQWRCSTLTIG